MNIEISNATINDLSEIVKIERQGFSEAEAGSEQSFKERIEKLKDTFLVAKIDNQVVGFVVGPASNEKFVTDEMYEKTPDNLSSGGHQLVLSIATDPAYRGKGIGSKLLDVLTQLATTQGREDISLDTLDKNIPFYESNGFKVIGVSKSTHADEKWYSMVKKIKK